jgi:hypothetical protein
MLPGMRLLHITLRNLLHHEIRIDIHLLTQLPILDPPLPRNREHAHGRLGVYKTVDAVGDVCEGEFVCCLKEEGLAMCMNGRWDLVGGGVESGWTYLANGFAVRDRVRCACGFIARLEVVGDQGRTEGFDHEVVVVEGCDDDFGGDAGEGSRDVGSRHLGIKIWCLALV